MPELQNLIEVVGDPGAEDNPLNPSLPICMQKCNLQISGYGRTPGDVLIQGDRRKMDVLRIDRANGIYLSNFTIEQGAFNDVDLVKVDGFHIHYMVARYAQNYGILSFTAVHGLYENIEAYNNGDSGVYPGSNAKGCNVDPNAYGICDAGSSAANPRAGCGPTTTETAQHQLPRQRAGLLGHGGQLHLRPRLGVPRQQHRPDHGLLRLGPSRDAAGVLPLGAQPDPLQQRQLLHRRAAGLCNSPRSPHARRRSCARSSRLPSGPAS